ncbi:hypothetical protein D3C78_739710 [compost metagenome]
MGKPTSLIGGPLPEEREERHKLERAQTMADLLLEGYKSGELAFEHYARLILRVVQMNLCDATLAQRDQCLGEAVRMALKSTRQSRGPGNKGVPQCIRKLAVELLEEIHHQEGRPFTRSPGNAFERCCELFAESGYLGITPRGLERWKADTKKARQQ